ncbi:FliM/FliN family flagellar motor switch protein [Undibacterium sp. TJN25]|uniref:FliM/FliN family flagellar motor switch protein n=1 Tax=Undibacterium sp. TJN25 TaxID=3413056 RepID=UPI003BF0FD4F
MSKTKQTDRLLQHQVLDPCLLGRPIHLLHTFTSQLREDFTGAFKTAPNRRYWASFQIEGVTMGRNDEATEERWIAYTAPGGSISFSLERAVLLSVLNYRYGRRNDKSPGSLHAQDGQTQGAVAASHMPVRITATEERLAVTLGQQLSGLLAARIEANLSAAAMAAAGAEGSTAKLQALQLPSPLKAALTAAPAKGSWVVAVTVLDISTGETGLLHFGLDHALMSSVLRGLASTAKSKSMPQNSGPLASRLQLKLTGRLVNQQVALGELLNIRVGDVIPVNLGKADVLLEDSRLFTAAVTEHKGNLCLTSFEGAE